MAMVAHLSYNQTVHRWKEICCESCAKFDECKQLWVCKKHPNGAESHKAKALPVTQNVEDLEAEDDKEDPFHIKMTNMTLDTMYVQSTIASYFIRFRLQQKKMQFL